MKTFVIISVCITLTMVRKRYDIFLSVLIRVLNHTIHTPHAIHNFVNLLYFFQACSDLPKLENCGKSVSEVIVKRRVNLKPSFPLFCRHGNLKERILYRIESFKQLYKIKLSFKSMRISRQHFTKKTALNMV